MRKKYDWKKLEYEFTEGGWLTVSSFLRYKGIPNNSYTRKIAAGWFKIREKYQEEIRVRAREKILEDEAEIRARQAHIAKIMQAKGIKSLSKLEVKNADHARKLLIDGMREERKAIGFGRKQDGMNLTQVNVSVPKTSFDKMLDNLEYEDLLQLIAEIRHEKQRRIKLQSNTDEKVTV